MCSMNGDQVSFGNPGMAAISGSMVGLESMGNGLGPDAIVSSH
jgi:hypothetical protein